MALEMLEEVVRDHRHFRQGDILVADDEEEKDESDEQFNWIRGRMMGAR